MMSKLFGKMRFHIGSDFSLKPREDAEMKVYEESARNYVRKKRERHAFTTDFNNLIDRIADDRLHIYIELLDKVIQQVPREDKPPLITYLKIHKIFHS